MVDRFEHVGTHDLSVVSDADFYSTKGGGGGARIVVQNMEVPGGGDLSGEGIVGENEKREVWVRKNHHKFRDPVYLNWKGECAVLGHACNGLLVASHIKPWSLSDDHEKVDPNNGLLLSVALDKLFDRGLIGFSAEGKIIRSSELHKETIGALGIKPTLALPTAKLTAAMKGYLKWHREYFGL